MLANVNAPAAVTPRNSNSLKDQLEAALNAEASADELIRTIGSACASSHSAAWEALALVDQFYRRRRISQDVYRQIKSHVEQLALGRPAGSTRPTAAEPARSTETTGSRPALAQPKPPQPGPPRPGLLLRGRYRLEAQLDYGHGVVFQALDEYRKELPEEEQRVAILFPANAADAQRQFFRAQQLSHPNIARVIEFDRDGDTAFYIMELQRGQLLRDLFKQSDGVPLPRYEALNIIRDIASALQHGQSRGVLHGRLNSSSVLVTPDGSARVLNFGLPRGEQDVVEPAGDLRALSLMAYELLAGAAAYEGLSPEEARGNGIPLRRPAGLHGKQWHALQSGLAAPGEGASITLDQWLEEMGIPQATTQSRSTQTLMQSRSLWPRRLLLGGALLVFAVAVAVVVATLSMKQQPLLQNTTRDTTSVGSVGTERAVASDAVPATASAASTPAPVEKPVAASQATAAAAASTSAAPPVAGESGTALLAFQSETFTVAPGESAARIPVRRSGSTRSDVGFVWSTESGSARAGDDFVSFGQQHELIPAGQKALSLYVPLSGGTRASESEFYITLSDPSGGAKLGSITRLKVIIAAEP